VCVLRPEPSIPGVQRKTEQFNYLAGDSNESYTQRGVCCHPALASISWAQVHEFPLRNRQGSDRGRGAWRASVAAGQQAVKSGTHVGCRTPVFPSLPVRIKVSVEITSLKAEPRQRRIRIATRQKLNVLEINIRNCRQREVPLSRQRPGTAKRFTRLVTLPFFSGGIRSGPSSTICRARIPRLGCRFAQADFAGV
jgi:hypothetical protein